MKKKQEKLDIKQLAQEARDSLGKVVGHRWYVSEVREAYDTGGYYSEYIPESRVRVSGYFDSFESADEWMGKHEADEGKYLTIRHQACYERVQHTWL